MSDDLEGQAPRAEPDDEPGPEEPHFLGLSERGLTVALTIGALVIVTLAVYITARLLVAQGDEVPSPPPLPNSVAPGFRPTSISFFGSSTGLVSGAVPCDECQGGLSGVIARTEDGGSTWRVVEETERPALVVTRIANGEEAWAAQTLCTSQAYLGCEIAYLRSTDGGRTWAPHDPPANDALVSPPPQPGPCRWDHPYPVSSSFPTLRHGWVLCSLKPTGMVYQFKGLYRTTDAGRSWTEMPEFRPVTGGRTLNPSNMPRDGFPAGVSFLGDGTGWMWTHGPDSSLSVTRNGGRHWDQVWHSPDSGDVRLVSASLTSHDEGWAVRSNQVGFELMHVSLADPGGPTWEPAGTWPAPPSS